MEQAKVGILSLCRAENYGAVLQSFALSHYIDKNFCSSEIVDYTPDFLLKSHSLWYIEKTSLLRIILSALSSIQKMPIRLLKRFRFEIFRKTKCRYSKLKFKQKYDGKPYNQYIVGSDQVFNLSLTYNDIEFLLPRVNVPEKKSVYAASFGVSELTDEQKKIFEKYLPEFKYISVREKTGCLLAKEMLKDTNISQMIDPVFLLDKNEWVHTLGKRIIKDSYIFIYAFKSYNQAYSIAKSIDSERKIIYINDYFSKTDNDVKDLYGMGPLEFLNILYFADFVITDSFHGVAFSIIFNKEFYAIPYPGTESRILDVLSLFELQKRVCLKTNNIDSTPINFDEINVKIKEWQKKAYDYLKCVLE